jgi:hypothetical protein
MTVPAFLSLEEARDRYRLGRTALADRMRHCQISPTRSGNRSFLDGAQIEVLDQLDQHLRKGRGLGDFHSPFVKVEIESEPVAIVPTRPPVSPVPIQPSEPVAFDHLLELGRLLEFLDRASSRGWKLPTSVVRQMLGSTPRGPVWSRFGFTFKPSGNHGSETAWAILKDDGSVIIDEGS